jgi:hypothetical protein
MSGGYSFDQASFRRVGAATRWAEQQMGTLSSDVQNSPNSPQEAWVQITALAANYNGQLAAQGVVYFRTPAGLFQKTADCWIKDVNGTALVAKRIYRGIFSGMLEQIPYQGSTSLISLPLFIVNSPAQASDPETPFYPYSSFVATSWADPLRSGYYYIGWGSPFIATYGVYNQLKIYNILWNSFRFGPTIWVQHYGPSNASYVGPPGAIYASFQLPRNWYHIPQIVPFPIPVGSVSQVNFRDPLGLLSQCSQVLCQYQLGSDNSEMLLVVSGIPSSGKTVGPVMGA